MRRRCGESSWTRRIEVAGVFAACALGACVPGYSLHEAAPTGSCAGPELDGVQWITSGENGERRRLDAWCDAEGPPVVIPRPARAAERSDTLRVVTWNVHVGSGDVVSLLEELGVDCGGEASMARPPIVLLLQEAWRGGDAVPDPPPGLPLPSRIADPPPEGRRVGVDHVARRCGMALLYVPSMRNGAGLGEDAEDRGNAILSTLPLSRPAAIELPLETQRRVAVSAVVEGPGRVPLRVTSLHLDVASSLLRVVRTGNATRLRQGLAVADALDSLDAATPGEASLMAGDLNTWTADETVVRRLQEHFPDSPPSPDESTRGDFVTDHVFFRMDTGGDLEVAAGSLHVLPDPRGSDHRPLVMEIVVKDSASGM